MKGSTFYNADDTMHILYVHLNDGQHTVSRETQESADILKM